MTQQSSPEQALEQVMRLYRGDLLPSCYDEWILPERDRWRQLFLQAAGSLMTCSGATMRPWSGCITCCASIRGHACSSSERCVRRRPFLDIPWSRSWEPCNEMAW